MGRITHETVRRSVGDNAPIGFSRPVGAEAVDVNLGELRKLSSEIEDVNARAAVDCGRILTGE
jgi:hypothetical protein